MDRVDRAGHVSQECVQRASAREAGYMSQEANQEVMGYARKMWRSKLNQKGITSWLARSAS